MPKYSVKKTFEISYAHRLLNYKGKCENLHGHNGKVEIKVESETLDKEEMVMDFTELGTKAKTWLNENLDHQTILSKDDPLLPVLRAAGQKCFAAEKNPTAEFLCKLICEEMKKLDMKIKKVKFWETVNSAASYTI